MSVDLFPSLDDEQRMLLDASVRFIEERYPLSAVRAFIDEGKSPDADYRGLASQLGWFGLLASEEQGGGSASGNAVVDAALVAAERGARLQPGPFPGQSAVVHALSDTGSPRHLEVLTDLVEGRCWATWAFSEEPVVRLRESDGALRVDGKVEAVAEAVDCAWLLVSGQGPGGATQVLVPADAAGVAIRRVEGLDVSRTWCVAELDAVQVDLADVVGSPGASTEALLRHQAGIAAVLVSAEAVGC